MPAAAPTTCKTSGRYRWIAAWDAYVDADKPRGDASREETAHKVAWSAVKKEYAKGDDGRWHAK